MQRMQMTDTEKIHRRKQFSQKFVFALFGLMSASIVLVLFVILGFIVVRGFPAISWDFITKMPEDGMTKGGIYPAIIGTFCLMLGSMIFAFPIGILSGIYVNEYTKDGLLKRFIKQMTNN